MTHRLPGAAQRGGTLIEVLIAILLCAFGLLGFAAMQGRASGAEFESLQRSQALVLTADIVNRMNANRANADSYLSTGLLGAGAIADCSGAATVAARDLCEWANLLRGSAETTGSGGLGAMTGARGCITKVAGTTSRYQIAVAWQGSSATGAPASTCGQGDAAFPDETLRRVVATTVCMALLKDTTSLTPRC